MTDRSRRKLRKELNAGTVALILLSMIESAGEALYGYEIAKRFESEDSGETRLGALYPVLRSLESQGLLSSEVKPSDSGPARKYYRLTDEGRDALAAWKEIWVETRNRVDHWLEA